MNFKVPLIIIVKLFFKRKEGAYMALANVGNDVNLNTSGGWDIESSGSGDRWWCMQRCLDRGDCQAVVVDSQNSCWLKNGIRGLFSNRDTANYNVYVKVPDS